MPTAKEPVVHDVRAPRGNLGPTLVSEVIGTLMVSVAFAPMSAAVPPLFIGTRGKPSIGDFEIAGLLLSWPGFPSMILVESPQVAQSYSPHGRLRQELQGTG